MLTRPLYGSGATHPTHHVCVERPGQLHRVTAVIARGKRPVPFRTRKLSPSAPMVLRGRPRGRVGRRRTPITVWAATNRLRPTRVSRPFFTGGGGRAPPRAGRAGGRAPPR